MARPMLPKPSHARTQSASPSLNLVSRPLRQQPVADELDHAFDSDESYRTYGEYSVRLVDLAHNSHDDLHHQLAPPPRVVSTSRPALGARLLSSLSNAQPAAAAAAALTRKGSVLHSRARSLAALVPKLNTSNTSTPEKAPSTANKLLPNLFHGESAPIRLGPPVSPTKEGRESEESDIIMDYFSSFTDRPGLMRKRGTAPLTANNNAPPTNRSTSWFTRKPTSPTAPKQPADELATLNINASLFPHGSADPLDPAAFNNLLINASNLLQRMQTAYREKVDYIASIRPEQEAQRDEVEGAETRVLHLKQQLEDMSRRAQEQEDTMKEMARELAEERMRTLEARETAAASMRMLAMAGPATTEDEHIETARRKKRPSTSNASDSGFESDMESVFSYNSTGAAVPETPLSPPCVSRMASFESRLSNANHNNNTARETQSHPVPKLPKILTAKTPGTNAGGALTRLGREGAAWATVDALRSENRELKRSLQDMQDSLQSCIDLVSDVNAS